MYWDDTDVCAIRKVIEMKDKRPTTIAKFEKKFAARLGTKHAFACCNFTHAMELGLRSLRIGLGDEVILSNLSPIPTVSAVLAVNAVPIFCDISPDTFNIDLTKIESLITKSTKAIIIFHFSGISVCMDSAMEIAKKHSIKLIEDCSEGLGSTCNSLYVGTFGDFGCFDFSSSGLLQSGEGAMLICNDNSLANTIAEMSNFGKDSKNVYKHFGSNYRMSALCASLLKTQSRRFLVTG
jgi:perosamine synthetase